MITLRTATGKEAPEDNGSLPELIPFKRGLDDETLLGIKFLFDSIVFREMQESTDDEVEMECC